MSYELSRVQERPKTRTEVTVKRRLNTELITSLINKTSLIITDTPSERRLNEVEKTQTTAKETISKQRRKTLTVSVVWSEGEDE